MNGYTPFKADHVTARAGRPCIWCPELIKLGDKAVNTAGLLDGKFTHESWHEECLAASELQPNDGVYPHESKRGSTEHV